MNPRRWTIAALAAGIAAVTPIVGAGTASAYVPNDPNCVAPRYQPAEAGLPRLTVSDDTANYTQDEKTLEFRLSLSKPAPQKITIGFCTKDGSAIAGKHYQGLAGYAAFAPGQRTMIIKVNVLPRPGQDGTRAMKFIVPKAKGALIKDATGAGTIHYFS